MIVNYDDYIFEQLLNESILDTEINFDRINNIINKITDKKEAVYKIIKKFNETENLLSKKHLATILIILFVGNFVIKNNRWDNFTKHGIEKASTEISNNNKIDIEKIEKAVKPIIPSNEILKVKTKTIPYISAQNAKISISASMFIKKHEKLRLSAYSIGDGMITIGYGHASQERKSPYKVGDVITATQAEKLFRIDIKEAEDGVKRMLAEWKEDGNNVKITQGMFDAMVSMAYNMGITGFRQSDFLDDLKNKDYTTAAKGIKNTGVSDEYPGLYDRRIAEYKLFIKDLS